MEPPKELVTKSSRNWAFTINNPGPDDDPNEWECKYCVWQKEMGAEGTPHYQGYVEFVTMQRLSAMKKLNPRACWGNRWATRKAIVDYCKKEETRIDGPWETGAEGPGAGARTDLKAVCDLIKTGASMKEVSDFNGPCYVLHSNGLHKYKLIQTEAYDHDDTRGIWYWGKPGTGKSRRARNEYPDAFMKTQNKWFDGYDGEDAIILDDLDKFNKLGHHLKIWADRYSCKGEIKGATIELAHKVFVVTSNYHPRDLWPDDEELKEAISRRFKIIEMGPLPHDPTTEPPKKKPRTVSHCAAPKPTEVAEPSETELAGSCDRCGSYPCFCAQNAYVGAAAKSIEKKTDKHGRPYWT